MVGPAYSHQNVRAPPPVNESECTLTSKPSDDTTPTATAIKLAKSESKIFDPPDFDSIDESFSDELEVLFELEKVSRNAGDLVVNMGAINDIIQLCVGNQKWFTLNDCILILSKKTSAYKESIRKMVEQCTLFVDIVPGVQARIDLINTLRDVSEGKIYLETERARLTRMLANIYEKEGNLNEAAKVMEDLKVEHIGTMSQREKAEIVIHQMRLYISTQQNDMSQIVAKRITKKFLDDPANEDLKLVYFKMKVELERESLYLNTCRHYQEIASCLMLTEDERSEQLINAALYCVLASYDNEQQDILLHLAVNKQLKDDNICKIMKLFLNKEIISWSKFCKEHSKQLNKNHILDETCAHGHKCWKELHDRVIEHNIFVISRYYNRVNLKRLGELLDLPTNVCEEHICRLVRTKGLFARIDRPNKLVMFKKNKTDEDLLNNWSAGVHELTNHLNKAYHSSIKEVCTQSSHNFSIHYA